MGGEKILVQLLSLPVEIAPGHLEHLRGDELERGLVDGGEKAPAWRAERRELGAMIAE